MKAKYRILGVNVLPDDFSMPKGETTATLTQKLTDRLAHLKSFWEEASLEQIEIDTVVHPTVVKLPKAMSTYHLKKRPKLIDGSGVTWPVDFAGKTLKLKGPNNFTATVTFPAGSLSLAGTAKEINKAILAAWTGTDKTVPIVAPERGSAMGQIRIQTSEYVSAGTTLEIDGGTAVAMLGLDAANRITLDGSDTTGGDLRTALVDAVKLVTSGQTEAAARKYVNGFHSVIVNFASDIGWWLLTAQANVGQVEFDIFGKPNTKLAGIYIAKVYPEDVFAHEFGHNLRFPNLYSEYGRTVGVELGSWDIMANNGTSHPAAWIKSYESAPTDVAKRWIKAEHVEVLKRPKAGSSKSVEVLLLPLETGYPATNPYSTTHPGVPLCHALQVPLDAGGNHSYHIENRQRGPWNDPTLGKIEHNLTVPGSGIVATETINTAQPDRAQATLVQPYELDLSEGALGITRTTETDAEWAEGVQKARDAAIFNFYPLGAVGDEMTLYRFPNGLDEIRLKVTEVVGTQTPRVLKVRTDWGRKGTSFDLEIKDWEHPPPWQSVDIWVDNDLDNGWDEYRNSDAAQNPNVTGHPILNGDRSKVGVENVLYARVRNGGDIAQTNVRVDFEMTKPPAAGPAVGFPLGTDWVDIPAGGTALAKVRWTPRTENDGHVCVRATAEYRGTDMAAGIAGESNQNNNSGRENITEWFLAGSSPYRPVSFDYVVVNPLPEEAEFYMHAHGLPPGMDLHVQPHHFRLGPGEQVTGHATLSAAPTVPFSDDVDEELPVVSLEAMVGKGSSWRFIGGVSGIVSTVRAATVDGSLDPTGGGVSVSASAHTSHGPIAGANVRMSLVQGGEREVAVERRDTDAQGNTSADLRSRQPIAPGTRLEVNISLSPTKGTGPAETTLSFVAD